MLNFSKPENIEKNTSTIEIAKEIQASDSLLEQPPIPVSKLKRKTRHLIIDECTILSTKLIQQRVSNVNIECKKRGLNILSKQQMQRSINKNLFITPVQKVSCIRQWFRNLTVRPQLEVDWSILHEILGTKQSAGSNELNTENGVGQIDLSIDVMRHIEIQNQSALQLSIMNDEYEAPIMEQLQPQIFFGELEASKSLSLNNHDTSIEEPSILPQSPLFSTEFEDKKNNSLDEKRSFELSVLKKLASLSQCHVHPIGVSQLHSPNCKRIVAAKTFAAILGKIIFLIRFVCFD